MTENLLNKVWNLHKVATLPSGQDQLLIGLHLIHEVTSPQAFQMIKERDLSVLYPYRTFATVDHIVPTKDQYVRPYADIQAEAMTKALEQNTREYGIEFFSVDTDYQGIVHIIGPELGLTQPGMTIACGDSHTSTHGAFGAIAFGVGTTQIRDILATQCIALSRPKVRRIQVNGHLNPYVYAKDIILKIISDLTVKGGIGYAYEYAGSAIESLSMEGRMTICNMSIEGGARVGYVSPDEKTFDYLRNRTYGPSEDVFDDALDYWKSIRSADDASYDDQYEIDGTALEPRVTWGINPGQGIAISETIPKIKDLDPHEREVAKLALKHMDFNEGEPMAGKKIDVAFIGSCTNSRITDLREAAKIVEGKKRAPHVHAIVVPGSKQVAKQAVAEGLDQIFSDAGFEWRGAGCSMCLAMNPDKLQGRQLCASSSNRNFIGRQGSKTGRTVLMSPAMVAAAAVSGEIIDVRTFAHG